MVRTAVPHLHFVPTCWSPICPGFDGNLGLTLWSPGSPSEVLCVKIWAEGRSRILSLEISTSRDELVPH